MTATSTSPTMTVAPAAPTVTSRIWNVARMNMANPFLTLVMPWLITAAIFLLNLAIMLMVIRAAGGRENLDPTAFSYNGGISWILFFMTVVAVQTMNLTFRFALGFSVTRRDFYLGSALYFVMLSLIFGTGIAVLAGVERATGGWGIDAAFFAPDGLAEQPLIVLWALYVMALLMFLFLGALAATVWVRWKAYGLYGLIIGLAVLLVAAGWMITASDSWGAIGEYLTGSPILEVWAWTLPVTVSCAVAGALILRRATPQA